MPEALDRYRADLVNASRRLHAESQPEHNTRHRPGADDTRRRAITTARPVRHASRMLAAGALGTLALVLVVWALLAPAGPSTTPAYANPYQHPNLSLLRTFKVFERSAVDQNGVELTPSVVKAMQAEGSKARGLEPQIGRSVTVAGAYPVSIVPDGPDELCLMQTGIVGPGLTGASCGTTREALEGDLIKHTTRPDREGGGSVLVGLASDANSHVEVTETDGTKRDVPVKENIYELLGGSPQSVTLLEAHGLPATQIVP